MEKREDRRLFLNTKSSSDAFYTPLCKLLNIRYPITQAGVGGFTILELVADVSNAGWLGILGTARMTSEHTIEVIRKVKKLTNNPFGVNLLLVPPEKEVIKA